MTARGKRVLRWAAVTVPIVLAAGFASGRSVPAGDANPWYRALAKPAFTPPDWLFPVAWSAIYAMTGTAFALVLAEREAAGRRAAVAAFAIGFALALGWQPLFFGAHRIGGALTLIGAMLVVGIVTAGLFARVRPAAGALMLPYLAWVAFAGVLTASIWRMNR